jgi:hypothetical protein
LRRPADGPCFQGDGPLQLFSEQNRRVSFQRKVLDGRGNVVEVNPIEDLSGSDPGYMMPTTRLAALR